MTGRVAALDPYVECARDPESFAGMIVVLSEIELMPLARGDLSRKQGLDDSSSSDVTASIILVRYKLQMHRQIRTVVSMEVVEKQSKQSRMWLGEKSSMR